MAGCLDGGKERTGGGRRGEHGYGGAALSHFPGDDGFPCFQVRTGVVGVWSESREPAIDVTVHVQRTEAERGTLVVRSLRRSYRQSCADHRLIRELS